MRLIVPMAILFSFAAFAGEECPIIYYCHAEVEYIENKSYSYYDREPLYKGTAASRNLTYAIQKAFKNTGYEFFCSIPDQVLLNPTTEAKWSTIDRDEKYTTAYCSYICEEGSL